MFCILFLYTICFVHISYFSNYFRYLYHILDRVPMGPGKFLYDMVTLCNGWKMAGKVLGNNCRLGVGTLCRVSLADDAAVILRWSYWLCVMCIMLCLSCCVCMCVAVELKNSEMRKKIACLLSIEGGHSIDSSLPALRMFYQLGVRSMALTHTCNTPW